MWTESPGHNSYPADVPVVQLVHVGPECVPVVHLVHFGSECVPVVQLVHMPLDQPPADRLREVPWGSLRADIALPAIERVLQGAAAEREVDRALRSNRGL